MDQSKARQEESDKNRAETQAALEQATQQLSQTQGQAQQQSQAIADMQAQVAQLTQGLKDAQANLRETQSQVEQARGQVSELTGQLNQTQGELRQAQSQATDLTAKVQQRDQQIADLQRQIQEYQRREGSKTKVLLIGGLDSSFVSVTSEVFPSLYSTLLRQGFGAQDILTFSYDGGELNGLGEYSQWGWNCASTRLGFAPTYARLSGLLSAYKRARPDVSFVLVGHSYGGFLALQPLQDPTLPVSKVITVDAPLHGVASLSDMWLRLFGGCDYPNTTFSDLQRIASSSSNRQLVASAQARGVYVATVGNSDDCYYKPSACNGPALGAVGLTLYGCIFGPIGCFIGGLFSLASAAGDETATQIIDNASYTALWSLGPPYDMSLSHRIVLHHWQSLPAIAQLVGRPR